MLFAHPCLPREATSLFILILILIFSFPSSFLVKAIISFLVKGFSSKWRLIFHPFADGAISAAFESGSVFYFQDLGGSKDLWVRFGYGHERLLDAAVPISQPAMTTAWPPFPSHHQLMLSGCFCIHSYHLLSRQPGCGFALPLAVAVVTGHFDIFF